MSKTPGTKAGFERGGRGVFKCTSCTRGTRVTTQANERICAQCYELAGYENMLSDNGELDIRDIDGVRAEFEEAMRLGSPADKLKDEYRELWDLAYNAPLTAAQQRVEDGEDDGTENRLTVRQLINEIWKPGKIRMPVYTGADITYIIVEKADLEAQLRRYVNLDVPAPWAFLEPKEGETERFLDTQHDD